MIQAILGRTGLSAGEYEDVGVPFGGQYGQAEVISQQIDGYFKGVRRLPCNAGGLSRASTSSSRCKQFQGKSISGILGREDGYLSRLSHPTLAP